MVNCVGVVLKLKCIETWIRILAISVIPLVRSVQDLDQTDVISVLLDFREHDTALVCRNVQILLDIGLIPTEVGED